MKQTDWKIVYDKYDGIQKRAVDFLSKEVGKYLIREEGVYTLYVLPCEKAGCEIEKNAIIIGLYNDSELIRNYVKPEEIKVGGFLVKVIKNPVNENFNIVILTATDERELFYAAVSFVDDYIPENAPSFNSLRLPERIFDSTLKEYSYSENSYNSTRSVFTWGHIINDFRDYIDNLARLKFNQIIIWNDYVPINYEEVISYAHSYGIEVILGYAWGWIDGCYKVKDISDARLDEIKAQIIKKYREEYEKTNCDGIYFQSFTERNDEYIGGRLIAEAVTTLVNNTAAELFKIKPNLKIQFGLHALSVNKRLEEIAKVDNRIEILWEDCGVFPYAYMPSTANGEDFKKALDFTKKILKLRNGAPVGLVFKGNMKLDWTKFVYQSGPYVLGNNAKTISEHDEKIRVGGWRILSAEWMQYGKYVAEMLECIKENALSDVNMCLAGTFDGGIWFPEALCAQMFRNLDEDYSETLKKVARRPSVSMG